MYINWLLDCSYDTSIIVDRTYIYTVEQKKSVTKNKKKHELDSNLSSQPQSVSTLPVRLLIVGPYFMIFQINKFLYVRMDVWVKMTKKKRKKALAVGRGREHGLGRYLQGREERAKWSTSSNQRTERYLISI